MITVPSSLRVQPLAASSAGHRTKDNSRPNISNTPTRFIPGGGRLANGRITAGSIGPASEQSAFTLKRIQEMRPKFVFPETATRCRATCVDASPNPVAVR
jgi:hypothetical protein